MTLIIGEMCHIDRIFACFFVCLFFFYYSAKVSDLKHFLFMKTDMVNKYCDNLV
jgi:hypothetical protein